MPIWLRRFTLAEIQEYFDKQQEAIDKSNRKSTLAVPLAKGPNISKPTYSTKAGK